MPPRPVYLSHPSSLAHDTGEHPERVQRIIAIEAELAGRDWLGYERVQSSPAERAWLRRVHTDAHIDLIERGSAQGGARIDPDTSLSPGSHEAALHGAGGAVELATPPTPEAPARSV